MRLSKGSSNYTIEVTLGNEADGALITRLLSKLDRRMLGLWPNTQIYLATKAVDMRLSFDGLSALLLDVLAQDPISEHLCQSALKSFHMFCRVNGF